MMSFPTFKKVFLMMMLCGLSFGVTAQTPSDAIMMGQGQICIALPYNHDSWSEYWEGTLKRSNDNLGTVTSQSVQPMFALGLMNNLDLIAGLNWMHNSPSAGVFSDEQGFGDFMLNLKYRAWSKNIGPGSLNLLVNAGFSAPTHQYTVDYLPFALGWGTRNGTGRAIVQYGLKNGFYCTGQYGYTLRSNTEIDRTYYYTDKPYYTNEVEMPNVSDWSVSLGFLNKNLKAVASYVSMNTLGGTDIRRQDMPFPSNNMDADRITAVVQYYFSKPKGLGLIATGGYTLSGRNMGQTTSFGGGITYQFGIWGASNKNAN
jgi:hypothetical protein